MLTLATNSSSRPEEWIRFAPFLLTLAGFLLAVMFSNGGNYGLPVVLLAFGQDALAFATVYFVTSSVLTYTVGVSIAASGQRTLSLALRRVVRLPTVYAVAAAGLVLSSGATVPSPVATAVRMLGNAALRTERDVASAAEVLGLDPDRVMEQLTEAAQRPASDSNGTASLGGTAAGASDDSTAKAETFTLPNGTVVPLPPGVTAAQISAIMQKRRDGEQPTAEERALMQKVFAGMRGGNGRRPGGAQQSSTSGLFGGSYIVFVKRGDTPVPVRVQTGLTDLDYSEVVSGLAEGDSVLVLPSAGLVQSQQEMKERLRQMNGGGVPGMRQAR